MAAYCTKCGERLEEENQHVCLAQSEQAASLADVRSTTASSGFSLDTNLLMQVLKNPYAGIRLDEHQGFIYGLIGIAAAILSFYIWAWSLKKQIVSSIADTIGGGLGMFGGTAVKSGIKSVGKQLPLDSHMLLLGIVSICALIVLIFLVGNWISGTKRSIKDIGTKLGAMQLPFAAIYLILAIVNTISLKASLVLLIITLLIQLNTILLASMQIYEIRQEKSLTFNGIVIGIHLIVIAIVFSSLSAKYGNIFMNIGDSIF
ncbi:hypothetical protein [Paenibacillus ferrarius]|uniref:hypothetical protein n=1 Tax=Paenibacillus ferrarius TaxID=1469647 RepID=UPI003D2901F1